MTDEEKYYVPDISEFYFSFNDGDSDDVLNMKCIMEAYQSGRKPEFRVKYLDKEDIESFGFEPQFIPDIFTEEEELREGFSKSVMSTKSINIFQKGELIQIYEQIVYNEDSGNWTSCTLFQGRIKNKSELKKLLRQLGIHE